MRRHWNDIGFVAILSVVTCGGSDSEGGNAAAGGGSASSGTNAGPAGSGEGANGSTTAGAGAGATSTSSSTGAGGGPVTPTISSWLGTNVAADLPRVDIAYQLSLFDTPNAKKDADGYPVAGASGTSQTDIGFVLPSGTYKISFKGDGKLDVSGIGKLSGAWTAASGEQRNEVVITGTPGAFGNFLTLKITNAPGQTVTAIHILYPGFDYDTPEIFLPQFLGLLKPFRALRFMEWENINKSALANWADHPAASSFGASPMGQPYEHIAELVNQTGKDCWVSVPEHATDDFVHQFAQFLAKSLDLAKIASARAAQGFKTPFKILLENSNETWNNGFSAYATFLAAAQAKPMRYTGVYGGMYQPSWMSGNADLMKVGQYEADRLVQIATIFKAELGANADIVSPVLSGWAIGSAYSDVGLRFIKDNYGDPKTYVDAIAIAPYFGADDAQTGTLDALFTDCGKNIASFDAQFQDFKKLIGDYGIQMVAYEGGQGLNGTTNQPLKHLAQHDQRMYDTYNQYFALWKKDFGDSLFMHFDLAGTPGIPEFIFQYGFWGSIGSVLEDPAQCGPNLPTLMGNEAVASVIHHCPKYRALMEKVPE